MPIATEEKICEIRILISVKELQSFKDEFPEIKWEAGDTKIRWNANDPDEVALANKAFDAYRKKHPKAIAYSVDKHGDKGATALKAFDPNAELILLQEWMHKG